MITARVYAPIGKSLGGYYSNRYVWRLPGKGVTVEIELRNMRDVFRELDKAMRHIYGKTMEGLIAAGLEIQGNAQYLVPVRYGNLKASAYTVWPGAVSPVPAFVIGPDFPFKNVFRLYDGWTRSMYDAQVDLRGRAKRGELAVQVGFNAYYAVYVHEDLRQNHINGTAKYLAIAVQVNQAMILAHIIARVRV